MPRTARIVIPEAPHHIIQRGNRNQPVFFEPADYRKYMALMEEKCRAAGTRIWAYCLMTNHVHLIAVPADEGGLRAIGEAHRLYTRYINSRNDWSGYLWQGRFSSYPMDDSYLYEAARYIELNPVRAGLAASPEDYQWSSARIRVGQAENDNLLSSSPLADMVSDWPGYWREALRKDEMRKLLEENETRQNPLGGPAFLAKIPQSGTQ